MNQKDKIVLKLEATSDKTPALMNKAVKLGFRKFYLDHAKERMKGVLIYSEKGEPDIKVFKGLKEAPIDKPFSLRIRVERGGDEGKVVEAAGKGAESVFLDLPNWKIIPIENLIAKLEGETKIYVEARGEEEIKTLLSILEKGVDAVVVTVKGEGDLEKIMDEVKASQPINLGLAEVVEKRETGIGDRVCIDTTILLNKGEGMLVGSTAAFLFFVHSETLKNPFTEPRPFRVNAGPVHSYVLVNKDKTKYLSELKSGDEVLIVDLRGETRKATVGRVKIERRPLTLIKAVSNDEEGSILLQNAETINLVDEKGEPIPVTKIKPGDKVKVYLSEKRGRHFGLTVDEFILEK